MFGKTFNRKTDLKIMSQQGHLDSGLSLPKNSESKECKYSQKLIMIRNKYFFLFTLCSLINNFILQCWVNL